VLGRYGKAQRAAFVIDPDGIVRHATVADHTFGRSPDDVLRVIGALQTEEEYRLEQPAAPALATAA
jgi:alkyl hydroperoxide reductase subunit AhpC